MKRMLFVVWIVVFLTALPAFAQPESVVIEPGYSGARVQFSPDGSLLAVFPDAGFMQAMEFVPNPLTTAVLLYDPATGEQLRMLTGARDYIGSLIFTPDGAQVIGLSMNGDLLTWDTASGALQHNVRLPIFGQRPALFWHPQTGELVIPSLNRTHTTYLTVDPVTGASTLLVHHPDFTQFGEWWARTANMGGKTAEDHIIVPFRYSDAVADLPLQGDEVWVVTPMDEVALLSLGTGEAQVLREAEDVPMFSIRDLVATDSGLVAYTVGSEDTMVVFDLTTGDVREIPVEDDTALLSPDGEQIAQFNADRNGLILSDSDGAKTESWLLADGLETVRPLLRLRFSPDGSRLAVAGAQNSDEQSVILVYDL